MVVDVVVVFVAERDEVVKVGGATVSPPFDVVGFGVVVGDSAAWDGACFVEGAERSLRALCLDRDSGRMLRNIELFTVASPELRPR